MRSNVVFGLLIVMLGGFFAGILLRGREHNQPPLASETPPAEPTASASATADEAPTAPVPTLDRTLRVVALDWELLAAGIMAGDGAVAKKDSVFGKRGLAVAMRAVDDVEQLENALARGGKDERGADVAILPLPRFVASYERLSALAPVVFFAVAWSDGREVLLSKKQALSALPTRGDVPVAAKPGDPAAFLALFAFDLAGVAPDRVALGAEKADWAAMTRAQSKAESEQVRDNLVLTTAQASRLIPFVAIAQRSLVDEEAEALVAFGEGWLEGHALAAKDASEAARKIAAIKNAPEPLTVLSALGQIRPASLRDNAHLLGLAGRDAVTLANLFERTWALWRGAKVLTIPPENAPVDGRIVATMVRSGGDLEGPKTKPAHAASKGTLLVHHAETTLDEEAFVTRIGFIAGAFPRSPIAVTVHPNGIRDDAQSEAIIARVRERYGLGADRVVTGEARPTPGSAATVVINEIP